MDAQTKLREFDINSADAKKRFSLYDDILGYYNAGKTTSEIVHITRSSNSLVWSVRRFFIQAMAGIPFTDKQIISNITLTSWAIQRASSAPPQIAQAETAVPTPPTFQNGVVTLRQLLPLLRGNGFSHRGELAEIILAPECEDWTKVYINLSSGFLDMLGDIIVESIDTEGNSLKLWIKTSDFGIPKIGGG